MHVQQTHIFFLEVLKYYGCAQRSINIICIYFLSLPCQKQKHEGEEVQVLILCMGKDADTHQLL